MLLTNFLPNKMELPSKLLEQTVYSTRSNIEGHISIVMDQSTHEEHLSQPLQTNIKQFKISVTFLTAYNGIFNLQNSNNGFSFMKSITDEDGFIQIKIPSVAYEIESLNEEIKRIIIDEGHYSEANYPFKMKPNFSTLGSITGITPQGPIINFMFDDSIRDLLEFHAITLNEGYNLSPNRADILSFDNIFIHTNIAQGMIFKSKRSGIIHKFTMDFNPGYKYNEKIRGGNQWYMMESKDVISSICFNLKNENIQLVSFNGQSVSFRLSIKEI